MSKTIIQLERTGENKRKANLLKHRSRPEGLSREFIITEEGLE
ncbi:DNA repair and recombination protein RadB [Methanohalophilus portucalensis FDF-1]|nr:DNA repair and recombination protein RadB [Methanohalophilus portucalensis FDF-1]